jgi:DUF4097 and DUF4098 domain-containing protein YvlB
MLEQQFATSQPVRLKIRLPAGDIEVVTIDGTESTVTVDGAPKLVEAMRVELIDDRLIVSWRRRGFGDLFGATSESLAVTVRVPHHSDVEIATASADATLAGAFAAVDMKSATGDLRVSGEISGGVTVRTVSGDVVLPRVAGDLTVKTVSSDIDVEFVGGSLAASSVSGDVVVGSLRAGHAIVNNVSGDVDLGIATGTNVDLDAHSASGELISQVPLSDTPGNEDGPLVVVRSKTVSGDFRLHRAA